MNPSRIPAKDSQAVHESEQRFRTLVEGVAVAIWECAPDGTVEVDSPSWRAFTGLSLQDYLESRWDGIVHPDDIVSSQNYWRQCLAEGKIYQAELRLRRANGQYCWTEAHSVPLRNPDGTIRKWIGMNTDISERKRAEEQRAQHERQLQLALDISGTSFWNYDVEQVQVWQDERMRRMWGEST